MAKQLARIVTVIAVFFLTTGFDQGTKEWARSTLTPGRPVSVIDGVWDWRLSQNPGAAFSSFAGHGVAAQIGLSALAIGALVLLGVMIARTRPEQRLERVALAMIGGGALGNLIDRVRDGAVTDFVHWHHWPIFNVADAALLVGAVLLAVARWPTRAHSAATP